jgi:2-hydroxychromene-2-carboxylate isomerase
MRAVWYFDFISPFAYLQWPKVRVLSTRVEFEFRPMLFAGLLQHLGHKGPAEIPGKREFTYRFVQWQAQREGVTLRFPPAHPFNPLAALRLCIAAGSSAASIEAIFAHLWREGRVGDSAESLRSVAASLGIADIDAALARPEVKSTLRANFDAALADRVFGVPSIVADGEVFWGNDATPMFEQWLADPEMFESERMRALRELPEGVRRTS